MISFACKTIELKDLITCSFDLNKTDYKLFMSLLSNKGFVTTNEIAKKVKLERSSVQKSIKRLVDKELVLRQQKNLSGGGYLFVYKIKDKPLIKKQILDTISKWNANVKSRIEKW